MKKRLKIGLIIDDSEQIPSWYFETIFTIAKKSDHELIFIKRKIPIQKKAPFFYRLFSKFENFWFKNSFDATVLKPASAIHNKIIFLHLEWEQDWMLTEQGSKTLKEIQLDMIYTIDYEEGIEENLSALAIYGLWFIRFGVDDQKNKKPTGFSEVMTQQVITQSSLIAKNQNEVYNLYEGKTKTLSFSVKNNFNSIAWKTSSFLPFRLEELSANPGNFLTRFRKTKISEFQKIHYPNFSLPLLFLKNSIAYFTDRLRSKNSDPRFSLHFAKKDFDFSEFSSTKFEHVPLPPNVFYADPFLIEKDGIRYIFFEEFVELKNKGHISVITIDEDNQRSIAKSVLDLSYHLSYPFVFELEGSYYMIPESSANKTVSLYKAKNFPFEWEFVMHLIENESLIDATIHYENGKWWLFACNALHPFVSTNDQLFIYYSDNLFSNNWIPHPKNPVATSIDNCRPAGRIFHHKNKLYRPAQNNASVLYGFGLKFNEILVLNENEYREKEILSIEPAQLGLKACHHIDFLEGLVVIDGIK